MKKVLVLTTLHKSDDVRIFFKEIQSINKLPVKTFFVVPHQNDKEFLIDEVRIIPIPKAKSFFSRFFINQFRVAKIILKIKPDIVHFHDPELIPLLRIIKSITKTKVIFDIHENITASFKEKTWIPNVVKIPLIYLYPRIEKFLIKNFDRLIIAEKSYKQAYNNNVVEILNYPLSYKGKIEQKEFNGAISFIYVGSITELRGIMQMLEIFLILLEKSSKELKFYLIGDYYPEELETKVKEFIKNKHIEEKVFITGRLRINEIYEYLKKSDIGFSLLAPIENHTGSLPTKIFEYMMFGLPSVVSNFSIYDDYLIKEKVGIKVDYFNTELAAKDILKLLSNKKLLKQMSSSGIQLVKNKWNWESEEIKLLKIYTDLLEL